MLVPCKLEYANVHLYHNRDRSVGYKKTFHNRFLHTIIVSSYSLFINYIIQKIPNNVSSNQIIICPTTTCKLEYANVQLN